ncbi:MAG: ATP synthase subunit I [Desulfobacteraceae bacterium]
MKTQQRILNFVTYSNWLLLIIASAVGFSQFSLGVGLGILTGGLIVTINFHLLAKTLRKAFKPPHIASVGGVIAKYYIRFLITAIIISLLMVSKQVDPMGLIVGLSVVVASMMLATLNEVRQLITKEAG